MGKLSKSYYFLLSVNFLFTVATALSNTFVNVYLWKLKNDYLIIGFFNLFHYLFIPLTFIVAGKFAKENKYFVSIRYGIYISIIFYLTVLLLGKSAVQIEILLGIILGTSLGFYWLGFNILYFENTDPKNRDRFNGTNGLLNSLAFIIAPFLSGWFIAKFSDITGYRLIFIVSVIFFIIAVILSYWLPQKEQSNKYDIKSVFMELMKKNSAWRNIFLAMMMQGLRDGIILFLIGLLVFIVTKNEFRLGLYTMIVYGVTFITYYITGRILPKDKRNTAMLIGSIFMAVAVLPLFFHVSYLNLLMYGVITSIFAPLYFIPLTSQVFDCIGRSKNGVELRVEYIILREFGLGIGRIISVTIFILMASFKKVEISQLQWLLLFSGSIQVMTWVFMRKIVVRDQY